MCTRCIVLHNSTVSCPPRRQMRALEKRARCCSPVAHNEEGLHGARVLHAATSATHTHTHTLCLSLNLSLRLTDRAATIFKSDETIRGVSTYTPNTLLPHIDIYIYATLDDNCGATSSKFSLFFVSHCSCRFSCCPQSTARR